MSSRSCPLSADKLLATIACLLAREGPLDVRTVQRSIAGADESRVSDALMVLSAIGYLEMADCSASSRSRYNAAEVVTIVDSDRPLTFASIVQQCENRGGAAFATKPSGWRSASKTFACDDVWRIITLLRYGSSGDGDHVASCAAIAARLGLSSWRTSAYVEILQATGLVYYRALSHTLCLNPLWTRLMIDNLWVAELLPSHGDLAALCVLADCATAEMIICG